MSVTQSHFRFGINELIEAIHGWHAAEDTNPAVGVIALDTTFLLRFTLQCDATLQSNVDAEFQYRKNGGTWTNITTTSTVVKAVTTTVFANADNTTQRLGGTGTFEASSHGCTHDGISGGPQMDIVASGNAETECSLQLLSADLAAGDVVDFRLTRDGGVLLDTYAVTPTFTMSGNVTVALTGIGGTAAVGLLGVALALGLTGAVATGATGSVTSAITYEAALTGVSGTSAAGTVEPSSTQALTGTAATGSTGSLASATTLDLTGAGATGVVGAVSAGGDATQVLSGVVATTAVGAVTETHDGTVALTGVQATSAVGTVVAASADASVALTGVVGTGSVGTLAASGGDVVLLVDVVHLDGLYAPSVALGGVYMPVLELAGVK